ncbi:MAG: hypothetical protein H6843_01270 [Rhodospirillaceae bacterium]|nr:hypothetical protein [Rhodospirillaceae bacterium]
MAGQRVRVLLNGDAGTLRGSNVAAVAEQVRTALAERWPDPGITITSKANASDDLARVLDDGPDILVVGGGDGTISGAVAAIHDTDVTLAVLPLGTMNLVARDIGMPLDLPSALESLIQADPRRISLGKANDRIFVSHISFGVHPRMVHHRDRQQGRSKLMKRLATLYSALVTWHESPRERVAIAAGNDVRRVETNLVVIANTPFAEGTGVPPKRGDLAGRELAVYVSKATTRIDSLRLAGELFSGRWNSSPMLDVTLSEKAQVVGGRRRRMLCSIDGELYRFTGGVDCRVLPESLSILVPPE